MTDQRTPPIPCANNCGFFGNPLTENLCSKCYKEKQKEKQQQQSRSEVNVPAAQSPKPTAPAEAPKPMEVEEEKNATLPEPSDKKMQQDKKRCFKCDKRVGLFGFPCYCGYIFCAKHRNAEDHECTFDFKAHGRKQLEKANPLVAPDRMGERI